MNNGIARGRLEGGFIMKCRRPQAFATRMLVGRMVIVCILLATACAWTAQQDVAVAELMKKLKNPDEKVRQEAVLALGEMSPQAKAVVPALLDALSDNSEKVRLAVASAFKKLGKDAVLPLAEALRLGSPMIRMNAAFVLDVMGPLAKDAASPLRELLKDKNAAVRVNAAVALMGVEGEPSSDSALAALSRGERIVTDSTLFSARFMRQLATMMRLFEGSGSKGYGFRVPEDRQPLITEIHKKYGQPENIVEEQIAPAVFPASSGLVGKVHYYGPFGLAVQKGQSEDRVFWVKVR